MNSIYSRIVLTLLVLFLVPTAGDAFDTSRFETYTDQQFRDYWYGGRGEISRYSLKQSRYGELHDGDAVLVFVTEKVNPTLQVKADKEYRLPLAFPEDALWNLIRLAPAALPQGEFMVIPGSVYNRFLHRTPEPKPVVGRLAEEKGQSLEGNPLVQYEIYFPEDDRTLLIVFETTFPYRIQSWEDTYASPKWTGGKVLTTRAVRTHTLATDYWRHHGNRDRTMLHQIGLSPRELASR